MFQPLGSVTGRRLSLVAMVIALLLPTLDPIDAAARGPFGSTVAANVAPVEPPPVEVNQELGDGLVDCPAEAGADYCLPLEHRPYLTVGGAFASPGHRIWYRVRVTVSSPYPTKFGISCADSGLPGPDPPDSRWYGYGSIFGGATSEWTDWVLVEIPDSETGMCGIVNAWNDDGATYEAQVRAIYPTTGLEDCPADAFADYCLPSAFRWYLTVDGGFPSPGDRLWYRVRVTSSAPDATKFGIDCADAGIPGIEPASARSYGYGSITTAETSDWTSWVSVDLPASETGTCGVLNGWNEGGTTYQAQVRVTRPVTGLAACAAPSEATYCLPHAWRAYRTADGGFPSPRGELWLRVRVTESAPHSTKFGITCAPSGIPGVNDPPGTDYGYGAIQTGVTSGWTEWAKISIPVAETGTCGVLNGWNGTGAAYEAEVKVDGVPAEQLLGAGGPHGNYPSNLESDPVNTATGNYVSSATDLALPGRGLGFAFTRTYNSHDPEAGVLGVGWRHAYEARLIIDPDGSLLLVAEDGARLRFVPDGSGGYQPPPGALSRLAPIAGGYELTRRDQTRYRFDATGALIAMLDRNDNQLSFTYAAGLLTQITDSVGRTVELTYTPAGRLSGLSAPPSPAVSYAYDAEGRLAGVTDLRGGLTAYTYDAADRLVTIVDPNAHTVVSNEYGADGRISAQTNALGERGTFAWDPATHTSTYTDANGGQWLDLYAGNALRRQVDPLGNVTSYAYDAAFNLTAVTDPRGHTTSYEYDAAGNLLSRTAPSPLSDAEAWTYTALNDPATYTDGRNNTTSFAYDAAGNLISETAADDSVVSYGRDPAGSGLLVSSTDPRGTTTTYVHDAQANLTSTTTPLGHQTTMAYDGAGRLIEVVEPRGNAPGADPADFTTSFSYDDGDLLTATTDPLGHTTSWTYDPAGNRASVTDAIGRTTSWAYDAANRLSSVTDAAGEVTGYAYDAVGNLVSRTDANNHVTTYAYDAANRLTSTVDPLGHDWSLTYDAAGNLATHTDANGQVTSLTHDALNRPTLADYTDPGTPDVGYAFDAKGNLTELTDGAGTETYTYDALDRPIEIARGSDTFSYAYDPAGNLTGRTYPGQAAQTWVYDDDGRLTGANGAFYAYDAAANLVSVDTPDGITSTLTHDRAGRLLEVAHTDGTDTLSRFTYALDDVGNRTAMTSREGTVTYRYDALDRLTEACWSATSCPGGASATPLACLACIGGLATRPPPSVSPPPGETFRTYAYDPVGNRLSEASNAGTTTYAYDAADRLASVTPPGQSAVSYTFDANGNQTAAGANSFSWDAADRLVSATVGGVTETYTYAGDGRRLSATSGGSTTQFVWDQAFGLPQLALERDGVGSLLRSYGYGLDLLSQSTGSATAWYHHDGLGSVVDLTDPAGASLSWSEYFPYGEIRLAGSGPGAPTIQPFAFAGEQLDPLTSLYHLRARQYDAGTGRFLSTDPLAPLLTDPYVGTYVYARNDPATLTDPSGAVAEGSSSDWILEFAKGGKQRKLDTGLRDLPDDEIQRRARDPNLTPAERRRYQTEEKARGLRHHNITPDDGFDLVGPLTVVGGAAVTLWWAAKWLSPLCGPAAPVCVVAL